MLPSVYLQVGLWHQPQARSCLGSRKPSRLVAAIKDEGRVDNVVSDASTSRSCDESGVGVELDRSILNPAHPLWHGGSFEASRALEGGVPSSHEGPQWLVVVQAGRLDDRDILFTGPPQPGGDANARDAASANHDPMAHRSALNEVKKSWTGQFDKQSFSSPQRPRSCRSCQRLRDQYW